MEKLTQLIAKLKAHDDKIDALLAHEELSDEQAAEHDRLVDERPKLKDAVSREQARLAREQERERLEADAARNQALADDRERRTVGVSSGGTGNSSTATLPAEPRQANSNRRTQPDAPGAGRSTFDGDGRMETHSFFAETDEAVTLRIGESRDAIKQRSYIEAKKHNRRALKAAGYKPWGGFKDLKEFICDGLEGHQTSAFREKHRGHFAAVQGMNEGIGSDGGYAVMPEFAGGIIDRVYSNSLWSMTDNYSVQGNNITFLANAETSRATGSRHGGMRGYWLGEGASATASKPTMREVTLKLVKLGVLVYLTQELLDDGGSALTTYVTRKASEEFNFMIGDSLINGTGVGQPLGILNSPSLVSVAKESGQLAATLETENIVKMQARFYAPNEANSYWLHNQDIGPELNTMTLGVGTGGVVTYMPPGGMSSAPYATLQGRPMMATEFNATLGTQGDIIKADLGQILSISKGGVMQQMSMHVQFLTQQVALLFTMRLNAGPWESSAITPYKGSSNTQSSFVALDTRS